MHKLIRIVAAGCLLSGMALQASAQTANTAAAAYPLRPITLIVPFPAGGPTDFTARLYADEMSKDLGRPIIVENRPGADSSIGAQFVARAAPDGYTLLFPMDVTLVMNPITQKSISYRPLEDFAPISLVGLNTSILVVPVNGPKTVDELIAEGKANPGKLNYGAGIITTRLAGFLFGKLAGIDAVYIPYKGSVEVAEGILNGSIQFAVDGVSAHLSLIEAGKERALAKLNNRPLQSLPDLKPLYEVANMPQLGEISTWDGIMAPRATPAAIVARLQQAVVKAANDQDIRQKLLNVGIVATSSTPEEFSSFIKSESDKWSGVVKESGLVLD